MRSHRIYDLSFSKQILNLTDCDIKFGIKNGFLDEENDYCCDDSSVDEDLSSIKWMYIAISFSVKNYLNNLELLFEEIDYIVADFEYPEFANNILSFFPSGEENPSPENHLKRINLFLDLLKSKADSM